MKNLTEVEDLNGQKHLINLDNIVGITFGWHSESAGMGLTMYPDTSKIILTHTGNYILTRQRFSISGDQHE